jgi:hypothetical protein
MHTLGIKKAISQYQFDLMNLLETLSAITLSDVKYNLFNSELETR